MQYTTEAKLPLFADKVGNWGAGWNGSATILDRGTRITLTAGENASAPLAVYLNPADDKIYRAQADAWATMPAIGIVIDDIVEDQEVNVYIACWHDWVQAGLSCTAGDWLYVDSSTPGKLTKTAPAIEQAIAYVKSDTSDSTTRIIVLPLSLQCLIPKEKKIALLASAIVGMQTADGASNIYTVPVGRKAVITRIIVRQPTASLAGGTDYSFGDGVNKDTWKTNVDLSGMTGTDDYYIVSNDNAVIPAVFDAGDAFGIKPVTGSTADADATIDVFGYEIA